MATIESAGRRTITTEKRKRGVFGWIVAIFFWGWQALMVSWLVTVLSATSTQYASSTDAAYRAGTAIGAGLGLTFVLGVWAFGSVIFGALMMFTRGKKILITQVID